MKLIQQSFEILEQKDFTLKGIKQFIERCARVSYKSEDRITDTSYEKFVGMLQSRDHARPLEFGTVHLRMYITDFHELRDILCVNNHWNDQWIKYHYVGDLAYITTNYRYYLLINKIYPKIVDSFDPKDNEYYPKRYTVHFVTDRVTMDSFRTHVGLSHLAESTRYCNYSKNKFDNEITFVIPNWVNTKCPNKDQKGSTTLDILWSDACKKAEDYYLSLIKGDWLPQQARSVLPLGIKSELISCGFKDAWENFFYRRDSKDAHPMAQEIAKPMHKEFIKRGFISK